MLQTITQTPKPMQVQVCTNDSAFAVLEKAQHLVAECMLEQDPTAASYFAQIANIYKDLVQACLLYTSPSPRDGLLSRMPSSA